MSKQSLADSFMFINHQITTQEKLLQYHLKADSLLKILIESNLSHHSRSTMSYYLWGVRDAIHQAQALNESLLNTLTKIMVLMEPPRGKSQDMH